MAFSPLVCGGYSAGVRAGRSERKAPAWAALGWPGVPQQGYLSLTTPPCGNRGARAGQKKALTRGGIRGKVPTDGKWTIDKIRQNSTNSTLFSRSKLEAIARCTKCSRVPRVANPKDLELDWKTEHRLVLRFKNPATYSRAMWGSALRCGGPWARPVQAAWEARRRPRARPPEASNTWPYILNYLRINNFHETRRKFMERPQGQA
jgi:hypothetical protein